MEVDRAVGLGLHLRDDLGLADVGVPLALGEVGAEDIGRSLHVCARDPKVDTTRELSELETVHFVRAPARP